MCPKACSPDSDPIRHTRHRSSQATHRASAHTFGLQTPTVLHVGNGLIFAFVVALWAAYFVPLAVRRYDEASKSNSIEKFSSLSRVVKAKVHREDVDATVDAVPAVAVPATDGAHASAPVALGPHNTREAGRIAARRRRRTLLTLIFAAAVVGGLTAFAVVPLWSPAVPFVFVAVWLVACRVQVRGERGISGKSVATAAEEEQTVIISGQFEDFEPHRKHVMVKAELESHALDEQLVIAVPVGGTTGEALWDPLPVTLPTYVTNPRAGRTVRTSEFGEPGAWTSGHIEGEDVELPKRHDDAGEERRAVGH